MPDARVKPTHQSSAHRCNVLVLIGVLCVGILLQILGVPLTSWDLDGSCDLMELSLLEDVAIISATPVLSPIFGSLYVSEDSLAYRCSLLHVFFHPPMFDASSVLLA